MEFFVLGSPKLKKLFLQNVFVSNFGDSDGEKKNSMDYHKIWNILIKYATTDAQELFLEIFENPSYFWPKVAFIFL